MVAAQHLVLLLLLVLRLLGQWQRRHLPLSWP